ncbi:MAG: hypothetical protein J0L96_05110 [Anaerolineae bacterium]|nr:hypothetical protein [Anaerolineae bacterium]
MQILDKRLPLAWLLGLPLSYFIVAYLENFYKTPIEVSLFAILVHTGVILFFFYLLGRAQREYRVSLLNSGIVALLFIALLVFIPYVYSIAAQFPNLLDSSAFHLAEEVRVTFLNGLIPSFFIAAVLVYVGRQRHWTQSRFYQFVDDNLGGLMLALLFFAVYLIFASIFNRPSYDADDIFFDADGNLYRWRYATENYRDYYWRPAHPFILIIIRPLVGILALLFKGDTLFAAFTLNALVAALCVYLIWDFVKRGIGNQLYALLIAALFGASATQLAFGSIIESYIYLSAVALIFLILLQRDSPLWMQVVTGLLAFGITISNVGQTFIAHFFVKRNLKQIIIYGVIVTALVVPLSLLNNFIYPNSQPYFWDLSSLQGEGTNRFPATVQRAEYLARTMVLTSFVAPEPLVIRDGWPFPKVWMFRASIRKAPMQLANFETPLGDGLALAWVGLMFLGGILFLKNIRKQDNGYFIAFIVTLLFYFALHLQYGKDVFLYATNWTYAITLFMALAWRELADKRWFQGLLLVFILLLLVNNAEMYRTMLTISSESVPFPIWR